MKKKLLYASPFPPLKSGIADYSEILVNALSQKFDITLYTDDYEITSESLRQYKIVKFHRDKIDFSNFDYIIYNIGNNPEFHSYIYECCKSYPGLIILHDCVLYYLFTGYYKKKNEFYSKTYEINGLEDFLLVKKVVKSRGAELLVQKDIAPLLPFNKELLKTDNKIMVHSQYAFDRVKEYTNNVKVIHMIQQISQQDEVCGKQTLFNKYKIPKDAFVVASFGMISETKLNHLMCRLIKKVAAQTKKNVCYIMVGEGRYVDQYVDNKNIFKTGYVAMKEFDSFIVHSDIILNLRHPSMGETSAALLKILQMGKPCIIVDEAWFSEIPDSCAVKLQVDNIETELEMKLVEYIVDMNKRLQVGLNAAEYIRREYVTEHIIDEIEEYLSE